MSTNGDGYATRAQLEQLERCFDRAIVMRRPSEDEAAQLLIREELFHREIGRVVQQLSGPSDSIQRNRRELLQECAGVGMVLYRGSVDKSNCAGQEIPLVGSPPPIVAVPDVLKMRYGPEGNVIYSRGFGEDGLRDIWAGDSDMQMSQGGGLCSVEETLAWLRDLYVVESRLQPLGSLRCCNNSTRPRCSLAVAWYGHFVRVFELERYKTSKDVCALIRNRRVGR
jgi:hypothetical protein